MLVRWLTSVSVLLSCLPCLVLLVAGALPVHGSQDSPAELTDSLGAPDTQRVVVAPVTSLIASDFRYDDGQRLVLSWVPSIDDRLVDGAVVGYRVYRVEDGGEPLMVAELPNGSNRFADDGVARGHTYRYFISALSASGEFPSTITAVIEPRREWVNFGRMYLFVMAVIISAAVIYFVVKAKRGTQLFVRKIAGLEAIDEAVGRATEMGRPVLFIPGIHDMDDVQTLAALTILGRVARTIADYDTKIFMPVARSLVMTAGRETIKASYQAAGRPDAYSDDMVSYITDEQFGYVAAVDGVMVREKPATIFLLGAFFAESLILAETGNSVGAIQIAGTARPAQLPFFIAACDFTLIGEELFAASAYLAGEPRLLGSLKGQDVGKGIAMLVILIGVLSITVSNAWHVGLMQNVYDWLSSVFSTR